MLARLCVEELSTNAIRHGINPRSMIDSADIRVIVDGEYVLIRLRDGGPAFNLKQFAARLEEQGNPRKGMGIRLMLHSATSVSYYRTYGMNTTIIRV
jgi:anti-sigma regulatory factor (Ser/Thr protein kinase)